VDSWFAEKGLALVWSSGTHRVPAGTFLANAHSYAHDTSIFGPAVHDSMSLSFYLVII
jgi:hypothetical protein